MKNIIVFGATSAIAEAVCRLYAKQKCNLLLLARDEEKLQVMTQDLQLRGAQLVETYPFEATDIEKHSAIIDHCFNVFSSVDLVLFAHGSLPDQQDCEKDSALAMRELNVNGTSVINLLGLVANKLIAQKSGHIAAITSVAGDRGRKTNYIYGASKALVSCYLEGLRGRCHPHSIAVTDIRPGFVDTPMTAKITDKSGILWAQPDTVANNIVAGIDKQKAVVYTPWFWRWIMLIIKHIPTFIFKRMSI